MALRQLALILVALVVPVSAFAQARHDPQVWIQFIDTHPLTPDWRLHLEVQPRWSQDVSELDHTLFRWAVGRVITNRVSVWGGHAWVPRTLGDGVRHEHRVWEQLSVALPPAARWNPSLRFRLEQRFQGWEDNSHRLRAMVRAVRPLNTGTWSIATWDELMLTFDKTERGPARGYDRNRVFGGVLRRLSPKAGLEFGYLLQASNPPTAPPLYDHAAFAWINLTY